MVDPESVVSKQKCIDYTEKIMVIFFIYNLYIFI